MDSEDIHVANSSPVIEYIHDSLSGGCHWTDVLLEAISLWTIPEENLNGRRYKYLIKGEALDWLLLSERLILEMNG